MTSTSRYLAMLAMLPVYLSILMATTVRASLPFSTSYPQQCTPLNITWTPTSQGYPYSIYIMAVGGTIESFTVESTYQPNANQITFQYSLPPPSSFFSSFIVAISDAQGNGNSSRILPINTDNGSNSNCEPWTGTAAWTYAGDSQSGKITDRVQCGNVRFYPVDAPFRGTEPFSVTWVPLGAQPISVSVPQSANQNDSYFIYTTPVPFASGTQVYQFMSDATGGGSGGGSDVYTISPSSNSSCLASGYNLANKITSRSLPEGSTTASYQNLAGAVDPASVSTSNSTSSGTTSSDSSSGKGKSTGGLVGGIIGAVIGVGAILLLVGIFLVYRRRQKQKQEAARKELPQFVDLDGDEDDHTMASMRARGDRRGVSQTYHVSPFTYQAASQNSPPDEITNEVMGMRNDSESQHLIDPIVGGGSPRPGSMSAAYSYTDHLPVRYPPTASTNHQFPSSMVSTPNQFRSESDYIGSQSNGSQPSNGGISNRISTRGSYVLRTRNDSAASTPNPPQAAPLPNKAALFGEGADAEMTASTRRLLQHADAGPVATMQSSDVEELPPSYGQWTALQRAKSQAEQHQTSSSNEPVTSEVTPGESNYRSHQSTQQ